MTQVTVEPGKYDAEGRRPSQNSKEARELQEKASGIKLVRLEGLRPEVQEALKAFDADGNGVEVIEIIAAAEKWNASKGDLGSFQLKAFPEGLQSTLKAFDQDGDGTVSKCELAAAAKMYADSKREAKRLRMMVVALMIIVFFTIFTIFGLTFAVVEVSKETKANENTGIMTVAGTSTPAGTARATDQRTLADMFSMTAQECGQMEEFTLELPGGGAASYKVAYVEKEATVMVGLVGGGVLEIMDGVNGRLMRPRRTSFEAVCLTANAASCAAHSSYKPHQYKSRHFRQLSAHNMSTMSAGTYTAVASQEANAQQTQSGCNSEHDDCSCECHGGPADGTFTCKCPHGTGGQQSSYAQMTQQHGSGYYNPPDHHHGSGAHYDPCKDKCPSTCGELHDQECCVTAADATKAECIGACTTCKMAQMTGAANGNGGGTSYGAGGGHQDPCPPPTCPSTCGDGTQPCCVTQADASKPECQGACATCHQAQMTGAATGGGSYSAPEKYMHAMYYGHKDA